MSGAAGRFGRTRSFRQLNSSKCSVIPSAVEGSAGVFQLFSQTGSGQNAIRRPVEIGWFILKPIFAQVYPSRIHPFDQRQLLGPTPPFQLFFASNGFCYFPVVFKPDQAIAIVALGEPIVFFPFMLEHPLAQVSRDADVDRPAAAGDNIGLVEAFTHRGNVI
jgi:hypothetical protein